jgi:large conductance mechanosensitive channel
MRRKLKVLREKKGIIFEFKEFISRGNVIDLAVGIIVGSAFTAIVNSIVNDLLTPVIGFIIGGINFEGIKLVLKPAVEGVSEEVAIYFGRFLQRTVDFVIIAAVVFLLVKFVNRLRRKKEEAKEAAKETPKEEPEPPGPSEEVLLLTEIRDLLKK